MKEVRRLRICGLVYRVVLATADEVPELATAEGFTSFSRNIIYIRRGLPASRFVDVLAHEVGHAWLEASGIGQFLEANYKGDNFEQFEETFIRLSVPSLLGLVEGNGSALVDIPAKYPVEVAVDKVSGRFKRERTVRR